MLIDDSFGGFRLHDFIMHQGKDLRPGVIPVFNGCHWVLGQLKDVQGGNNNVDNAVVNSLVESNKELKQKLEEATTLITALREKITKLEANETSLEKWIDVEFNGETEKTVSDDFITADSVVDFVFLNGNPTTDPMTSVEAGSVTVSFEEAQTGTIRLQITKKK